MARLPVSSTSSFVQIAVVLAFLAVYIQLFPFSLAFSPTMAALSFFVGVVGNIVSILLFASPIPTFCRIVKRKSTEDFESLPYVCTLLQASLWIYYGLTKPGAILIATVNVVGVAMEITYVTLFLIYAPPKIRVKTSLWVAIFDVGFLGVAILVTRLAMHGDLRIQVIGFLCGGLCIIMYGSPLSIMKTVVTIKSVEFMPFHFSFVLSINGVVWTFYSVLTEDLFVGVPNAIGLALGTAQLILYAIYRNAKGGESRIQGLEDGKQPLLQPVEVHENGGSTNNV